MDKPDAPLDRHGELDPHRRAVLTGLAAAYLTSFVPAAAVYAADGAGNAFLAVSRILTGRPTLDPMQAARLREALSAGEPQFDAGVQALVTLISERNLDLARLQPTLDAEHPELSALPRRIMTAWYTGIVGEGGGARCVSFETSLMYAAVADRLKPPSYCYGPYGSWTQKPGEEGRDG